MVVLLAKYERRGPPLQSHLTDSMSVAALESFWPIPAAARLAHAPPHVRCIGGKADGSACGTACAASCKNCHSTAAQVPGRSVWW